MSGTILGRIFCVTAAIALLCGGLQGCDADQSPADSGQSSVAAPQPAASSAEPAAPERPATTANTPEHVQLDLSLPDDVAVQDDGAELAEETALLPDMFGVAERARRTTIKGGLILDEEETPEKKIPGVDGAQVDVEIRID